MCSIEELDDKLKENQIKVQNLHNQQLQIDEQMRQNAHEMNTFKDNTDIKNREIAVLVQNKSDLERDNQTIEHNISLNNQKFP